MPRDYGHPPAFPLYAADFSSDGVVEAMTTEQVGAYTLLLCKAWYENPPGTLPDNDSVLARWARLTPDQWTAIKTGVLAAFTLGNDSRWHQKRMRNEYAKMMAHRREKQKAGKKGAAKRWGASEWQSHSTANGTAKRLPKAKHSSSSSISISLPTNQPPSPQGGEAGWSAGDANDPWTEAADALAEIGCVYWREAIHCAKERRAEPERVLAIVSHSKAKGYGPGAVQKRLEIDHPRLAVNLGWSVPEALPPAEPVKRSERREAELAAKQRDVQATAIIKACRRAGQTDEQIKPQLQSAGLDWPKDRG